MIRAPCCSPARLPLAVDRRGVTAVEFAIIAPVICLLLVGGFDTAHTLYMRASLQGVVQKTARDSSLESGLDAATQTKLDDKVRTGVKALANNATITITRRFYRTFADAASADPEAWTDTNKNGRCDNHEPYQDENNNTVWDKDGGDDGQGGAKDRTLYTVAISYPRMFPMAGMLGLSNTINMSASTVLENQPYSDQGTYATPTLRYCP